MIAKNTTVAVNFLVLDLDGFPATGKASSISATISINGAQATSISDTIVEKGAGWYYFTHAFNTAGNAFISFTSSSCTIEPWEDEVVEMAVSSGPTAADIATAVWSYEDGNNLYYPYRTIRGIEYDSHSVYQPYGPGHDIALSESIWGYDPSALVSNTTAGKRLIDIQTNAATTVNNMPTEASIAEEVWTTTLSGITPSVNSTYQKMVSIPANVWTNNIRSLTTRTVTYQGTTSEIASSSATDLIYNAMATYNNLVTLQRHGDESWATASTSGLATATDVSNAQTAIINAMPSTTGLATGSDVSTAQAAIIAAMPDISGLSTFDPANDTVLIDSTQAATMTTATGFATPSDISSAQSAIIAAMPDISGLSTFDPVNDTVLIDSTQAASMATATGFATPANVTAAQTAIINAMPDVSGLSTFDAANDTVTINSTQAATMTTATGFATPTNVTDAVSALETYGDAHWTGGGSGGGGITAEDVWKYSGTYGRSLTVSPTDISSLATKTDLATSQTAIVNAMPSTAGLATATNVSDAKADIIAAIPDVSGLSTFDPSTDTVILASAQTDAIASSVWSDTTIYTGNSKGNRLSGIYNTVQNIPGQVWMVDADYGATIQGTMGQAIYNMFNDHATATDVSVVADLLEQIDAGVLHWSTTATRLTLYKEDNSVLRVYALERDADGNITRINPVA